MGSLMTKKGREPVYLRAHPTVSGLNFYMNKLLEIL